jgi:hypothetical protein
MLRVADIVVFAVFVAAVAIGLWELAKWLVSFIHISVG